MAFDIYLGNVKKRINSTLQADYSAWTRTSAVWKDAKDLDFPVVTVTLQGDQYPQFNAMYIPAVKTYYWITEITSVRAGVWRIAAVEDVLATYREQILLTDCYIMYGFNQDASGASFRIQDSRQNVSQVPQVTTAAADITGTLTSNQGLYSLTAVGSSGGVCAYLITPGNMRKLLDTVSQDINDAIVDFTTVEEILKYFTANSLAQGSAIQAIRSCIWMPVKASAMAGYPQQNVMLGDFDTGVVGRVLDSNPIHTIETDIAIPWPAEDWKRMNCQLSLYVPFVGTISIPVDQCNNVASLHITWVLELIGGTVSIRIEAGDYTVYTGTASIGASYAIGSSNVPIQNFVSGTVSAIGGAMQFGAGALGAAAGAAKTGLTAGILGSEEVTGGIQMAAQGITQAAGGVAQAITPVVQCAGTLSGSAAVGQSREAKITVLYYPPVDDPGFQAVYGHPVMRMGRPVLGYCQTRGFSMAAPARFAELAQVATMMDGGVFIE